MSGAFVFSHKMVWLSSLVGQVRKTPAIILTIDWLVHRSSAPLCSRLQYVPSNQLGSDHCQCRNNYFSVSRSSRWCILLRTEFQCLPQWQMRLSVFPMDRLHYLLLGCGGEQLGCAKRHSKQYHRCYWTGGHSGFGCCGTGSVHYSLSSIARGSSPLSETSVLSFYPRFDEYQFFLLFFSRWCALFNKSSF